MPCPQERLSVDLETYCGPALLFTNGAEVARNAAFTELYGLSKLVELFPPTSKEQIETLVCTKKAATISAPQKESEGALSITCVPMNVPENGSVVVLLSAVDSEPQGPAIHQLLMVGQLAAGVSHDANNALTTVLGRLLRIRTRGQLTTVLAQDLDIIDSATRNAATILRRLQDFSKRRTDELELVPLADVLDEISRFVETQIPEGVSVTVEVNHTPDVVSHRQDLMEVLLNLTGNALDAVEASKGTVTLRVDLHAGRPTLEVQDNGCGIPVDVAQRMFDPFFSTKKDKGTGLGLSMSKDILEKHGIELEWESTPSRGTTFRLVFPKTQQPVTSQRKLKKTKLTVVVVDDDIFVSEMICELLLEQGHEVHSVNSAARAVELVGRESVDLLLTDLDLPETDGWKLARQLRSKHPELLIGMVTGWPLSLEERASSSHTVDFILNKPFTLQELRVAVERIQSAP